MSIQCCSSNPCMSMHRSLYEKFTYEFILTSPAVPSMSCPSYWMVCEIGSQCCCFVSACSYQVTAIIYLSVIFCSYISIYLTVSIYITEFFPMFVSMYVYARVSQKVMPSQQIYFLWHQPLCYNYDWICTGIITNTGTYNIHQNEAGLLRITSLLLNIVTISLNGNVLILNVSMHPCLIKFYWLFFKPLLSSFCMTMLDHTQASGQERQLLCLNGQLYCIFHIHQI